MPNQAVQDMGDRRIMTLDEFAKQVGISLPTLRRLIATQRGPVITRLSERRIGIQIRHGKAWLDARTNKASAQGDRDVSGGDVYADQ